jgi:hypothetical protein
MYQVDSVSPHLKKNYMNTYKVHKNYRKGKLPIFEDHETLRLRASEACDPSIVDVHKSALWAEKMKLKYVKEDSGEIMCVPPCARIRPLL